VALAVARVSFVSASASFRPPTLDEPSALSLNYPLTIGDHVWTEADARTELQLGSPVVGVARTHNRACAISTIGALQLRVGEGTVGVPGAATAVSRDMFIQARPPGSATVAVSPDRGQREPIRVDTASSMAHRQQAQRAKEAGGLSFPASGRQPARLPPTDVVQRTMCW
jgi:hypothetical protein